MLIGLLANGNLLIEGLPGSPRRARSRRSRRISADFARPVHARPAAVRRHRRGDLRADREGRQFQFQQGPVFANLVLADEINRAPAKVQSALLEAMEERQVTVAGKTYTLPELFMVLATQNPIEQEGTYPLPEAQLDRFLMHVVITYPDEDTEGAIIKLDREENAQASKAAAAPAAVPQQAIFDARARDRRDFRVRSRAALHGRPHLRHAVSGALREPLSKWIQSARARAAALRSTAARGCAPGSTAKICHARSYASGDARLPAAPADPDLRGAIARRHRRPGHRQDRVAGRRGMRAFMPEQRGTGVYVDLEQLIALEQRGRRVSFLPRQPVHSLLSGRYASRMRGRGLNFEEIRDYRPGDDVRSIDWKVTARLQQPHVRVFNEERDRQALLVVDQRLSMFFGSRLAMKSVTAAQAAAVWPGAFSAGDRIGGIVFNDTDIAEVRPQRSRRNVLELLHALATKTRRWASAAALPASLRS